MQRRIVFPLVASALLFTTTCLRADTGAPQSFDSNGVKIFYTVEGKGEPVLLIHGFAANADLNWRQPGVIKALAENYKVIALDNRGHGKSDKPHDPAKYGEEMAEDAVRLLDHLGIKKAHIVGYSMGGMITAKLLTLHPDRFITATLGGHGGVKEGDDMTILNPLVESLEAGKGLAPLIAALTPPGRPQPPAQFLEVINKANDQKALAAVVKSWKGLTVSYAKLKENKVPTLALIGDLDPLKKGVDALDGKMPNLKIVVIEGADHMDAPRSEKFQKELKAFLAEHKAGTNGQAKKKSIAQPVSPTKN